MRRVKATALKKNDVIVIKWNCFESLDSSIECWNFGVVHKINKASSKEQIVIWTQFKFNHQHGGQYTSKPMYFSIEFLNNKAEIFLVGKLVQKGREIAISESRELKTKKLRRI